MVSDIKKKDDIKLPPHYTIRHADHLPYPLDRPNRIIWLMKMTLEEQQEGKWERAIKTNTQHPEATVDCGIYSDFDKLDGLTITKQLTPYDKLVYVAAATLFNAGNDVFSVTQIHKAMGNEGQPAPNQIQQINDSLTKMGAARIYLDNKNELKVNKGYKRFKYDGDLLPFERISAYINGKLTDAAIHLFREPPLITFARERKQITSLPRTLLQVPISKTIANLTIEDYLLTRIGRMNHPKSKISRKMLFSTIYEECGITDKKQKQRVPRKIKECLERYRKTGFISGYIMEKDSVTIQPKKSS